MLTPVAEISLALHGLPTSRTSHSIRVRARTTSGTTGRIRAALYEGAVNRSGDLESAPLTTAFADYTLPIPDAGAAAITSYANLSIRVWGYDPSSALVFQVAQLSLKLPTSNSVSLTGSSSVPLAVSIASAGAIALPGATAAWVPLSQVTAAPDPTVTSWIPLEGVSAVPDPLTTKWIPLEKLP